MSNEGGISAPAQSTVDGVPSRHRSVGVVASLVIALLAGAVAWTIVWATDPVFRNTEDFGELPVPVPLELAERLEAVGRLVDLQNGMLILGILGVALGGSLACSEGLMRRNLGPAVLWAALGAAPAAAFGVFGAWLGDVVMSRYGWAGVDTGLNRTICVQAAMLASLGLGVGLAVGLTSGIRRLLSATVAGAVGGAFAAMVYPISAAFLLPNAYTETLIPVGAVNRLLWIAVFAGIIGLTVGGMRFGKRGGK